MIITALVISLLTGCAHVAGYAGAHPAAISCKGKGVISGQGAAPVAMRSEITKMLNRRTLHELATIREMLSQIDDVDKGLTQGLSQQHRQAAECVRKL